MGEDSVILTRDSDGKLHVLLNSCPHRGRTVCQLDRGNPKTLTRPYHGWTFGIGGELRGVPYTEDAYYGEIDKTKLGLRHAAQVASYRGLVFGTWDNTAPSLKAYLGDIASRSDLKLSSLLTVR